MVHTFAVYVDDKPGVLNRVASLFRRRAFNIESLTVGHTETPGLSRMTVVVDTDEYGARRLEAHLHKLVPVRRVDNITTTPYGRSTSTRLSILSSVPVVSMTSDSGLTSMIRAR